MKRIQVNIDLPDQIEPTEAEQMPYPKRDLDSALFDAVDNALEALQKEFGLAAKEFDWAYDCEPLHNEP